MPGGSRHDPSSRGDHEDSQASDETQAADELDQDVRGADSRSEEERLGCGTVHFSQEEDEQDESALFDGQESSEDSDVISDLDDDHSRAEIGSWRTSGSPHGVGRPHAENRGRFFSGPVNCPMATTLESSWVLKGKEFLENTWVGPVENSIPNYLSNRRLPCRRDHGSPPKPNYSTDMVRKKNTWGKNTKKTTPQ